jgi:hypothetical protein
VESKYRIEVNATASSQLNRAITTGSEKGTFLLPKGMEIQPICISWTRYTLSGPSGKVKLAPKARADATKEVCPLLPVDLPCLSVVFQEYQTRLQEICCHEACYYEAQSTRDEAFSCKENYNQQVGWRIVDSKN